MLKWLLLLLDWLLLLKWLLVGLRDWMLVLLEHRCLRMEWGWGGIDRDDTGNGGNMVK
jgi:hypothetical protein